MSERESRLAAIGQMTSAIVHDLKNPLSSIIGFAEITRQDILTGKGIEMVTQDLEPVISEANRLPSATWSSLMEGRSPWKLRAPREALPFC